MAGFQLIPLAGGLALLEGRIFSCSPTLPEEGAEGVPACLFLYIPWIKNLSSACRFFGASEKPAVCGAAARPSVQPRG